jgi:hypothetical protein
MTRQHEPRTTDLIRQALAQNDGDTITLEQFLAPLESRAFGFLLVLLALPNFIPIPMGAGGATGSLVVLIGVQMLWGFDQPWLPKFARSYGFKRSSVEHFVEHMAPLFNRLERVCKPRLERLTHNPYSRVSGFLLIVLGVLLALPIPFTNYPFGMLTLLCGVALIEHDGGLMAIMWASIIASLVFAASISNAMIAMVRHFFS